MVERLKGRRVKVRPAEFSRKGFRFAVRRGYRLNVLDAGNPGGQPVVFVHGMSGSLQGWAPQIQHLASSGNYRIIAYDLDGHGHSDHRRGVTLKRQVDDLSLLLDKLGVRQPVFLVGHSVGGMLAQLFTFQHPDRVAKLALVSSAPEFPEDARNALGQFLKTYRSRRKVPLLGRLYYWGLMRHLYRDFSESKAGATVKPVDLPSPSAIENHLRQFFKFHASRLPLTKRPPTLLLCAALDSLFGRSQQALANVWSGDHPARLVMIPDSRSHLPQLEHPTKVNRELESFLEGTVS